MGSSGYAPNLRERSLRAILASAMALSLGGWGGVLLSAPETAMADEGAGVVSETGGGDASSRMGTLTLHGETGDVYELYRVFTADVDASGKASHIEWADDIVKSLVVRYISGWGYDEWLTANGHTGADAALNAQNALEFITTRITNGEVPSADSFAMGLAKALVNYGVMRVAETDTIDSTETTTIESEQGYYLILSYEGYSKGTPPIWAPIGGEAQTKTSYPTIKKEVKEDSTQWWGDAADANLGEELSFKLTATLPDNFASFSEYFLRFEDTLPEGMDYVDGSLAVKIEGADVELVAGTDYILGLYKDHVISVEFPDITKTKYTVETSENGTTKRVEKSVTKDSVVTVEYKATLNDDSIIGSEGNENTVEMEYTSDPVWNSKSVLVDYNKVYTYSMVLVKTDARTGETVPGAKYTVSTGNDEYAEDNDNGIYYKVGKRDGGTNTFTDVWYTTEEPSYTDGNGVSYWPDKEGNRVAVRADSKMYTKTSSMQYVQADGSLSDTPYEFETGADGCLTVPRIDSGTYTINETNPPAGYLAADGISVEITSSFAEGPGNAPGRLMSLGAAVTGGMAPGSGIAVSTHLATADDLDDYGVTEPNAELGLIGIVTSDDKTITLPITGLDGVSGALAGGALMCAAGGIVLAVTRRREGGCE